MKDTSVPASRRCGVSVGYEGREAVIAQKRNGTSDEQTSAVVQEDSNVVRNVQQEEESVKAKLKERKRRMIGGDNSVYGSIKIVDLI